MRRASVEIELSEDEVDLLDSIYLPSKYPLGLALPDFAPDRNLAQHCLAIAKRIVEDVRARNNY